jgi:hypothetical protein
MQVNSFMDRRRTSATHEWSFGEHALSLCVREEHHLLHGIAIGELGQEIIRGSLTEEVVPFDDSDTRTEYSARCDAKIMSAVNENK